MQQAAAGFAALGVGHGDVIAQFADNSSRWLLADQVRTLRVRSRELV